MQRTDARPAGFWHDLATVAFRALRAIPREPENIVPALVIPVFFFWVNLGAFAEISAFAGISDYKAFQIPVAIIFAVTGISRAIALVTDISSGYFDRLLVSPVDRLALLLGLMASDFVFAVALCIPVLILGFFLGVYFATGLLGILIFLMLAGLWALVYTGFPYAIALKTGNPSAVMTSFILFMPFIFLTTAFMPLEAMTGWMAAIATYNPTTYILEGLRSLITEGWVISDLLLALAAIAIVGVLSLGLAFWALKQRVSRN